MRPAADVYAGDIDQGLTESRVLESYRYLIVGDACPDVLLRVAVQLNLANRAPQRLSLRRVAGTDVEIEAVLGPISSTLAANIARKLDQQPMIVRVQFEIVS